MDMINKLGDHLFLSLLTLHLVKQSDSYHYDCRVRKTHNSLAYIAKGSVEMSLLNEKVYAKEGDLIFVPERTRYISRWIGSPDICFYNVHFSMTKRPDSNWKNMKLQRIDGAPNEKIRQLIDTMYTISEGNEIQKFQTVKLFYQMLTLLMPHIKMKTSLRYPVPLQKAIQYIERNYTSISSVREISEACFVSESHLYHVFKDYLDTSPVSYLNHLRIHAAIELLANSELSVAQIAERLNFHSENYFRKTFQKITGELPSKMRKMLR